MPWANGLGTTIEIATDRDSRHSQSIPWTWRLSIADVPNRAAFSIFAGVDRWIACLHGKGMRIERNGDCEEIPNSGDALSFAGEEMVIGDPIGASVRDVNWFLHRNHWQGGMRVHRETGSTIVQGDLVVIHAVAGTAGATIRCEGQTITLAAGFTVQASGIVTIDCDPSSIMVIAWASAR